MDTDSTWFAIIAIILSAFLAIFLILAIVLVYKTIKIVKEIKKITDKAELIADRAEHISAFFERTSTPVAFLKLISNISDTIQNKVKKR